MTFKFKIFFGTSFYPADEKLNEWIDEHPELEIAEFVYRHGEHGHSICISYFSKPDNDGIINREIVVPY